MSQSFVKESFVVVDVLQPPTKTLTGHYAIIFAYCKLQVVSFQKLLLPHNDIDKSLYTFPNNWGGENLLQFQEMLYCHCYKVSAGRMKECDRCHDWFLEVCKDFNYEDHSENQWFCRQCIDIHRLPYEIIDIFVNLAWKMKECTLLLHKCVRNGVGISIKSLLKIKF